MGKGEGVKVRARAFPLPLPLFPLPTQSYRGGASFRLPSIASL